MANLRPNLLLEPEMGYCQLGEPWRFAARWQEADVDNEVYPDSAAITILRAGGQALSTPVAGEAMTVNQAEATYTLPSDRLTSVERFCIVELALTEGSRDWTYREFFDVVRFSPRCPISMVDVQAGQAELTALHSKADPDGRKILREAWSDVLDWLKTFGFYPDLVLPSKSLGKGVIYRARELMYGRGELAARDGLRWAQMERWRDEYESWQRTFKPAYDIDQDGLVDVPERHRTLSQSFLGRRTRSSALSHEPGS